MMRLRSSRGGASSAGQGGRRGNRGGARRPRASSEERHCVQDASSRETSVLDTRSRVEPRESGAGDGPMARFIKTRPTRARSARVRPRDWRHGAGEGHGTWTHLGGLSHFDFCVCCGYLRRARSVVEARVRKAAPPFRRELEAANGPRMARQLAPVLSFSSLV